MAKLNTVLRLRRDNDYNYKKIADKFIPANGEICLVDTARSGLRAVCGDGKTLFGELDFIDSIFLRGYYSNNTFYKDSEKHNPITNLINKLYIDIITNTLYYFDGEIYQKLGGSENPLPPASAQTAGVMKLYDTVGQNTDGTMTQKAISDELDDKVELILKAEEELIIFVND